MHAYISNDSPSAAQRVSRLIVEAIWRLKPFPQSGRKGQINGTYELVVPKLPFIVVYVVTKDTVDIIAIFHVAEGERKRVIE